MRYDAEHKARTRERVLREASAAIRLEGPERVGVAGVMTRAGLTHGGFYAHFKSKDDLVAQAIGFMFEDRYAAFLGRTDAPDPRTALIGFINAYLSMRHRAAIERGCPIPVLAGEIPRLPNDAREIFVKAVDQLISGLSELLEATGARNAPARASSMLAEMVGALALSRIHPDDEKAEILLTNSRQAILDQYGLA